MTTPREAEEEILPPDDDKDEEENPPAADEPEPEPEPEEPDMPTETLPHVSGHRYLPHDHAMQERCTWEPGKPTEEQIAAIAKETSADAIKAAKEKFINDRAKLDAEVAAKEAEYAKEVKAKQEEEKEDLRARVFFPGETVEAHEA